MYDDMDEEAVRDLSKLFRESVIKRLSIWDDNIWTLKMTTEFNKLLDADVKRQFPDIDDDEDEVIED